MHVQPWVRVLAAVLAVLAVQVRAGEWYAGVEGGYSRLNFRTHYDYANQTPGDEFTDRAQGFEGGVIGGYRQFYSPWFSGALQGRVAFNRDEWRLDTDEPAHLKYDLPVTAGISVVPALHPVRELSVFAEIGVGEGYVREEKESFGAGVSAYNEARWVPGLIGGVGLHYEITRQVGLYAVLREAWFERLSFDSFTPDGQPCESIWSDARSESLNLGLSCTF